ncbi:hypothetical protein CDD82_7073 [Ophiocordyceps australis]|uniref:Macro-like domain-containing protein n=1 Tax=Ophiocordyceps australis TaxID=1399860 RepID=A0A2C5YVD2_9HYPO|nr:hypothetical protein CDD82_7073 [Ophiocordyceps australis]
MAPAIPHIHLLCMNKDHLAAFTTASTTLRLPSSITVEPHVCPLKQLPPSTRIDLIVSPANSYGRLDGGFDDAISRALSPRTDYLALTRAAQHTLYRRWHGFAPPGTCTLVRVPDDFSSQSANVWGVRHVALCPTMRVPADVTWDREVVYEAAWSLLCAVHQHNAGALEADAIGSLLVTPLATGVGRVSADRWAGQFVLALKHFDDATKNPGKWSCLDPSDILAYSSEVAKTWKT